MIVLVLTASLILVTQTLITRALSRRASVSFGQYNISNLDVAMISISFDPIRVSTAGYTTFSSLYQSKPISITYPGCAMGFATLFVFLMLFATAAFAQNIALDPGQDLSSERNGWLPYAFSTDALGTTAGVAAFSTGRFRQPQTSLLGTAFASANDSWGALGAINNMKLPGTERLFLDSFLLLGHFTDSRYSIDLDRDPEEAKAGSNDSSQSDFVTGISNDVQFDINLKFPLPIGIARDNPVTIYNLDRGLPGNDVNVPGRWNPLEGGKTIASVKFFSRYQDLEESSQEDLLIARTNGLELVLEHDNTDFLRNPTRGSRQKFTLTRDFGWFNSSNSWTNLQIDLSKYFNLGGSGLFRQQVLAFNFWAADTPTWSPDPVNPQIVRHRPPPYMGSTLGGFDRLRAFRSGRFNDKSAVYTTAEMRLMPRTGPLRDYSLLNYFEIDWFQLVPFIEAGRVGPEFNSDLLTDDLQVTGGIDLRIMAFRNVFRIGWATDSEGESQIWAMFSQPFSR